MGALALRRFVGLSFVLPSLYFASQWKVLANMSLRLLGISGLIGLQGFLGWYMVKSGLKDDLFAPGRKPPKSFSVQVDSTSWGGVYMLHSPALKRAFDSTHQRPIIPPHARSRPTNTPLLPLPQYIPKIRSQPHTPRFHIRSIRRLSSMIRCRTNIQRIPTHGHRLTPPKMGASSPHSTAEKQINQIWSGETCSKTHQQCSSTTISSPPQPSYPSYYSGYIPALIES
jgi:hypothetical protein